MTVNPEVTSTTNPTLFAALPALPTGYEYVIQQFNWYQYGSGAGIYRGGVRNISSGYVIWGNEFIPNNNAYTSPQNMVDVEMTSVHNSWYNGIRQIDVAIAPAAALIGF